MSQAATEEKLKQSSEKEKANLLGLSLSQLGDWVEAIGEKRFRATQIIKWIHQMGECRFDEMNNLSKDLRAKLEVLAEVKLPEVVLSLIHI